MDLFHDEKVKDLKGYEGLYAITSYGRFWSHRLQRWMSIWTDNFGYQRVSFSVSGALSTPRIHRLVGTHFIKNPEDKPQINHKNGIKNDNKVSNLEWCTSRENHQHACDMGLIPHAKLTRQKKHLICRMYHEMGVRKSELARTFDVSPPDIHYIIQTYTPLMVGLIAGNA